MYEAGFRGFTLHDRLVEDGIGCVVLPPHLMLEAKVNRVKTDRRDAWRLAKMLEDNEYRGCYVPDRERREDRQVCRTLNAVEKEIKSTRNRIRKLLQFHGIEASIPNGQVWGKREFREIGKLSVGASLEKPVKVLLSILESLWTHQMTLRKELLALSKKPRYQKAFTIARSIPGIGWLTSIRLVLELGEDFTRFSTSKSIANFLGLTGSEYSTGETEHKGRITGQGPTFVRSWMIESAWVAIRKDPVLRGKFEAVWRNSGSKKKAIVAVARKLAVRLRSCMVLDQEYQIGLVA
jgi:transposase